MARFQLTVKRMMILVAVAAMLLGGLVFSRRPSQYDVGLAMEYHRRGSIHARFATLANGRWVEAIAEYDQAIRLKPDFAEAFEDRGMAWRALGQGQRADADIEAAVRLDPMLGRRARTQ